MRNSQKIRRKRIWRNIDGFMKNAQLFHSLTGHSAKSRYNEDSGMNPGRITETEDFPHET